MNRIVVVVALTLSLAVDTMAPASAQERPTGLEMGFLPAINFDADEGLGYGALAALYQYEDGSKLPYVWSALPIVFFTTEGRRDVTVFFDAPHLLEGGWRLDAFIGNEHQIATPYYGVGNATPYDQALEAEDGPDPYYYRFGRTRRSARFNLQHPVGDTSLRWLFGAGLVRSEVEAVPEDAGTTLFAEHLSEDPDAQWTNFVRAGLVWDTRDRESGPTSGSWTELLVQRVDPAFGADVGFTRWTLVDRRYFSLAPRLVFAHRFMLQGVSGDASVWDLATVASSFQPQEGLGGSSTVRGVLKNRFIGKGIAVWNAELRWRAVEFSALGKPFHMVLSAFFDQGRVWAGDVRVGEIVTDLHHGVGGGLRVGMGEDFVVAIDMGRSAEAGKQLYIGLGYLY